jgi:K+-sensing histidine kinase KdpD
VNELNSYVIENFITKVQTAKKTNQKSVTLDIKEAQTLIDNLSLVLSRALGNLENAQKQPENNSISVSMDGGNF